MGAWNYGVFDDDTAYDALTDLKNSLDIIADMKRYFDEVKRSREVERRLFDVFVKYAGQRG